MKTHNCPVFGLLNLDDDSHWACLRTFEGRQLPIDLNIELGVSLSSDALELATSKLEELVRLNRLARTAMIDEFNRGEDSCVALYQSHLSDGLDGEATEQCFGGAENWQYKIEDFINFCMLIRVGLYPTNAAQFLVMDYSLIDQTSDYSLVVSFDHSEAISSISMES